MKMKAEAHRQRERKNKIGDGGVYYTAAEQAGERGYYYIGART
jgi:hypothetical protein